MRISNFIYSPTILRCQHIKVNGVQCGSPALKNRKLCHFHQRWQQGRIQLNANRSRRSRYSLDLPILEDANSIQVALMQGMRLLLTNQVDHRTAALLFYALQTASSNLRRTTFEPRPQQVVIDPCGVPDTSLGDDAWYKEEFTEVDQEEEEDGQEVAETNDEPADDSPETINIHAMAESGQVGDLRRVSGRLISYMDPHLGVKYDAIDSRSWQQVETGWPASRGFREAGGKTAGCGKPHFSRRTKNANESGARHPVDTYLARDYTLPSSFPNQRLLFASAAPVRRLWPRFPALQLSVVPMLT